MKMSSHILSFLNVRTFLSIFLANLVSIPAFANASPAGAQWFVMGTFRGNGEDGLHLAWSTNAYHWQTLLDDRSVLRPTVGEGRIMRDPCLYPGPDGTFHLVWTTGWTGKTIGYARSTNLLNWSEPVAIPVMADER